MRLSSILINGVERIGVTLIRDFEITQDIGDRMSTARMLVLYNPADSSQDIEPGQTVEIWRSDILEGGSAVAIFGEPLFGEPMFGDVSSQTIKFRGVITMCEPRMLISSGSGVTSKALLVSPLNEVGGQRVNVMRIEVRDFSGLLDATTVQTAAYTSKTDQYIVRDLITQSGLSVDTTDVASTATISSFDARESSLRDSLAKLADLTGCEYFIDSDDTGTKFLHWFLPTATPAPISFSESPDCATSFPFDRDSFRYTEDWHTPCNEAIVVGQVGSGGASIRRVSTDATSVAKYGKYQRTIVDRQIKSNAEADARGSVEIAKWANPQISGTCQAHDEHYRYDSLAIGQLLTVNVSNTLGKSGNYIIRRISMKWWGPSVTVFEFEWGDYRPDVFRTVRKLYDMSLTDAAVQSTTPVDSSVGTTTIIPGSVTGGTGGSLASLTIEDANIKNATITGTAKIKTLSIDDTLIASGISATKITTGTLNADLIGTGTLTVGGSGHVGQVAVVDASNNPLGWIGKSGSYYGAWFPELYVGGSGPASPKMFVTNGGAMALILSDGDSLTLVSATSTMTATLTNLGINIHDSSTPSDRSQMAKNTILVANTANYISNLIVSSTQANIYAANPSGNEVRMLANSTRAAIQYTPSGATISSGTGSPEGAVTANPGSIWLRSDGGSGTTLYVKESGSGNTGWVAK